jgi:NADP-dependent 3-hydroxy acid dehydrogenase YdfG
LVVGASGGVGRAIAMALAGAGADLVLSGRDEVRLSSAVEVARGRGYSVVPLIADLSSAGQLDNMMALVQESFGGIDILVHAAGSYSHNTVLDSDGDELEQRLQSNVLGPYQVTRMLLPSLIERRGDIVFINSTQGQAASPGLSAYAATHHAIRAVADSLRAEVNPVGVRVTTVHLGRTATALQEAIHTREAREYQPERLIQPEDVAALVVATVSLPNRTQVPNLTIWPTRKV